MKGTFTGCRRNYLYPVVYANYVCTTARDCDWISKAKSVVLFIVWICDCIIDFISIKNSNFDSCIMTKQVVHVHTFSVNHYHCCLQNAIVEPNNSKLIVVCDTTNFFSIPSITLVHFMTVLTRLIPCGIGIHTLCAKLYRFIFIKCSMQFTCSATSVSESA